MNNQKNVRVLIAEDDYLISKSTAALLKRMGYTVVGQALDGREAVEMTQSLRPDVILMDVKMPVMDGIEAIQHIYETCPTPVVALTAYATSEVTEQAIAAGTGAYLTKPASPPQMERAINITMARFADMMELRRLNAELQAEIAEHKRTEEALKESEERYRDLVEKAGIAILLDDEEGGFQYFNETFAKWFGYSVEEMKQQSIRTLVHPDDVDRVMESHTGRIEGRKTPSRYEFRGVGKDGSIRYLEVDAVELKDGDSTIGTSSCLWDITDRKRTEEALRESEEKYRDLVENINDVLYTTDENGLMTYISPAIEPLSGYSPSDVIGRPFVEFLYPEDSPRIMKQFQKVMSGHMQPSEYRIVTKSGEIRWVRSSSRPIFAENRPIGLRGLLTDITERKRAEEALRESHERFLTIVDGIDADVYVADMDTCEILFMNEHMRDSFGHDLVGKICWDVFRGESGPCGHCTNDKLVDADGNPIGVYVWEGQNPITGNWYMNYDRAIKWIDGRLVRLQIATDITERKRAEEALQESEARYRAVVEDQTELICRFQPDGTLTFMNEAYCRYFGKRREELIGNSCMSLIPEEDRETAANQFTSLSAENPTTTYEHRVLAAGDRIRWQQWTDRAIFDERGRIVEYQSVGRDITERRQAQEEIEQRNRELAALNVITGAMMQSALDLDEVLQRTADGIVEGLGCNTAFILLLDEEKEVFKGSAISAKAKILAKMNALVGFPLLQINVPAKSDFNEAMSNLLNNRITIKHDFYELVSPYLGKRVCFAIQKLMDSKTFFTMPLLAKGKTIGGIIASTPDKLTEKDTEKLMTFANQAAIAIENAQLFKETRQLSEELAALNVISQDITSSLDLDETLQRIADSTRWLTVARRSRILLINSQARQLLKDVNSGYPPEEKGTYDYERFEQGISGWVACEKRSALVPDVLADERSVGRSRAASARHGTKSVLVSPLIVRGEVIGTLAAVNLREDPTFTAEVMALVEQLAAQAAIAIENARLYQETQQRALEQETLREAALALTTALDRNRVIERILAQLQRVVPYDSASVQLLREDRMELVGGRGFPNLSDLLGISFPADGDNPNSEVIRTRAPFIVKDASTVYEGFQTGPHQQTVIRSWLGVPMLVGERLVGMIALDKSEPAFYTQEHARLAEAFAAQAAVAFENARLFEETQQRMAELDALRHISLQLTSSLDLADVLDSIAENTLSLVGATNCHIYLYDETSETFTFGAALWQDGRREAAVKTPRRDGLTASVVREGQAVVINDAPQHPLYTSPEARKWGLQAIAIFPLKRAGRVLGVFSIAFLTPHTFSQEELRVLGLLADQAAIAIENARLFTEAEQRATELSTMLEVARAVSSTLDLEEVLALIAEQVAKTIGATGCTLSRWDREADAVVTLTQWRQRWTEWAAEPGVSYALDDFPITRAVLEKRQPITIQATDPDADPAELALMQQAGVASVLMLPLVVGERVIGLVELDETERGREFTAAEIRLCQALADQVAVAIENARLFDEEKRRSAQLALISEVSEKAASILDSDRLMQEVTSSIQESFNYYNAALLLLDDERRELVMRAIAGGFGHMAPGEYRQSIEQGLAGFVARTGKSWLASDVSQDPHYIKGLSEEVLTGSELGVPIKLGDKVLGVLVVQSTHLNDFDQSDVVAMEAVADRIAIAIQNARLYEETQQQSERLAQTLAVSELLHRDLELEQLLEQIAQGTVGLGFRRAVINVCQPGQDVVRVRAMAGVEGADREVLMGATYHWSDFQSLMQERFRISRSYLIRYEEVDWERDFRGVVVVPRREDRGLGYWHPEDMLLVPLWGSRGELVGLLSVDEPVDGLLPDLNTVQTLEAFANQAATAIENARLFEQLEKRRVYLERVLGAAPDAIVTLDAHHRVVEWNSGAERLFGYSREEAIGRELDHLVTKPDVFEEAIEFTQVVMSGMEVPPTEIVRYRKDGSPVDVLLAGSPILVGDELIGAVAVYTDITARKRMEKTLRALALVDDLTNLYNRRGFLALAEQQLKAAHRAKRRMILLFADFDGLKQINDAFGHSGGDRALIETANVLRETFRESDIIARIGGDEFVVLAVETDSVGPEVLVARLQGCLKTGNARVGHLYELSLSVGIAHYDPENPCSIDELLARADRAMYEKKRGE